MKPSKVVILVSKGLILLGVVVYLLRGMETVEKESIPQLKTETKADLRLEEIHFVEMKGEKKEWELRAKSAQHFTRGDLTLLEAPTVTFFADDDRIVTVRGKEGSIKGKKEIEVRGDVVITSSDGYRVVTNSLRYDGGRRQIYTSDPVLIERGGMRVKGVGVLVDMTKEKLFIQKEVQTEIER